MSATATPVDVLEPNVIEVALEYVPERRLGVAVVAVGNEGDVRASGRRIDRVFRLLEEQVPVRGVFGPLEGSPTTRRRAGSA